VTSIVWTTEPQARLTERLILKAETVQLSARREKHHDHAKVQTIAKRQICRRIGFESVKAYADSLVVGLIDDGNYDASTNTFPTTGGSGTSGAVLKG
jgi:hypothetical protein